MKRNVLGFLFDTYRNTQDIIAIAFGAAVELVGDAIDKAMDVWGDDDD